MTMTNYLGLSLQRVKESSLRKELYDELKDTSTPLYSYSETTAHTH